MSLIRGSFILFCPSGCSSSSSNSCLFQQEGNSQSIHPAIESLHFCLRTRITPKGSLLQTDQRTNPASHSKPRALSKAVPTNLGISCCLHVNFLCERLKTFSQVSPHRVKMTFCQGSLRVLEFYIVL